MALQSLNVAKTGFMIISSRQKSQYLNDKTINSNVDGVKITHAKQIIAKVSHRTENIDENLAWKGHIQEISKKVASQYQCT